ncbi:hypothetical protein VPNG_05200 [Cytospora leucostoma]|uniref:Aromatic prenyltransferase (DMATS family) n=1 Tax=Cytospora leucostoma TaxID=1230097 RepID=A0A423X885_9PEZI|nr:hypothetical protein VPNG_05200 [Cytospora leucostoma]
MAKQDVLALPTFGQVSQQTQSLDDDEIFWWGMLGQSLATLLETSQYSNEEQLYYLRWFRRWIVRSLEPRPVHGRPFHRSDFTYDGSPLEYSLNWKEKKASQTIRFTTEPRSREAGTAADPLNQLASQSLLTAMAKEIPGIDLTRFNLFLAETHVPDHAAEEVLSKLPPGHPRARVLVAYDLEHGAVVAKAYFNPELRAIHTGLSTKTVVFDIIRKCNGPYGAYDASIGMLRDYLDAHNAPDGPQIFLLSNDCVADSPASRIKVYVTAPITTLRAAMDAFSLGGTLSGSAIEAGLNAIHLLWCHIFGIDNSSTDIEDKEVLPAGSRCVFVYEMRPTGPGQQGTDMEVKMHMPGSWFGQTDTKVGEALAAWFQKHGHSEFAARYQSDLTSAFPKIDLDTPRELAHTWISLTHTPKTGLYMTMYYTPKITQFY